MYVNSGEGSSSCQGENTYVYLPKFGYEKSPFENG